MTPPSEWPPKPLTDEERQTLLTPPEDPPVSDPPPAGDPLVPPTPRTRSPMLPEKCMQCGGPNTNTCSDLCPTCVGGVSAAAEVLSLPATLEVGKPVVILAPPASHVDLLPSEVRTFVERLRSDRDEAEQRARDAEWSRDQYRHSLGRANSRASEAETKLEQMRRALREGALELNAAGIRTTVDHLVNQPAELPSLVRRLGKSVRELQPSIDALRAEVKRLNGEALDHPKAIAAKDEDIRKLKSDVDAGKQREKALERTAAQMQVARDSALRQLKQQESFGLEAARANDELRAKVEDLEAQIVKLRTPAKAGSGKP